MKIIVWLRLEKSLQNTELDGEPEFEKRCS